MRRQLPAHSPLDLACWGIACREALRDPSEARSRLKALLARRYPCEGVVLVGSGTQALELAIRLGLRGERPGAPVALPAYSCFDLVTAAVGAGVPVLFYDLDPETLCPDLESLQLALTRGARAVVAASLFGFPLDWDALRSSCKKAGAVLIEDAAQGLGSSWKGREGGALGDLTILSFGRGKGWTGGGGGALLLRGGWGRLEEELEAQLASCRRMEGLRSASLTLVQWGLGRPSLYGLPSALPWLGLGETVYHEPVPLQAIPSFCAALAMATGEASTVAVLGRRERARKIQALLGPDKPSPTLRPVRSLAGGESSYLRLPVLCSEALKPLLASREARPQGIVPGYPRPLLELPAAGVLLTRATEGYPGARELSRLLFTLPTHSLLHRKDFARMATMLGSTDHQGR